MECALIFDMRFNIIIKVFTMSITKEISIIMADNAYSFRIIFSNFQCIDPVIGYRYTLLIDKIQRVFNIMRMSGENRLEVGTDITPYKASFMQNNAIFLF